MILWTTATVAVGLGALAPGLTVWMITKTAIVERMFLVAAGPLP